ncbi:MAG: S9 family peptidase [Gemmataceae bacterium]
MQRTLCIPFLCLICVGGLGLETPAQTSKKKPLDHKSYDLWNSVSSPTISNNGNWIRYTISVKKGDSVLKIVHRSGKPEYSEKRVRSVQFTNDSRYAVYLLSPEKKKTTKSKTKSDTKKTVKTPAPKQQLVILDLSSGKKFTKPGVRSFSLPSEGTGWLAYLVERSTTSPKSGGDAEKAEKKGTSDPKKDAEKTTKGKASSYDLIVRNLKTEAQWRQTHVSSFSWTKDGVRLAFLRQSENERETGVYLFETKTSKIMPVAAGKGDYQSLVFDRRGKQLAFFTNRDNTKTKPTAWCIYCWSEGTKKAIPVVTPKSEGIPKDWVINASSPSFSNNGKRIFFTTKPKPEDPKKVKKVKVKVDIWHWKDPYLQPQQLKFVNFLRNASYRAVVELTTKKVVQLADKELSSVSVGAKGDADVAVGRTSKPYRMISSWDSPTYYDIYFVDVTTGQRKRILKKLQSSASLSPEAKYLTWWDNRKRAWMAMSVASQKVVNLTSRLPHPVYNELHDLPALPGSYGTVGWLKGDKAFLVYDKHDIWAIDPATDLPAICVTDGVGRKENLRFRYTRLERSETSIDPRKPMLLSAFHFGTKASGYYQDRVFGTKKPTKLVMLDESLRAVGKAKNANRILVTRSTFEKYPDVWLTNTSFQNMKRLTDANPQQKKFLWGTAELVNWRSLDGTKLDGILYKPEGFDPNKKYPMMVYFYERRSSTLHSYVTPRPSSSSINISFYVSRGYLVFVPDIPYRVGHPGQSCVNAVLPGVTMLIQKKFVHPKKIGVQGHSWGGYQIAYLVTKTNMFAAAEAGAPVSNMTSAYGGIRWSSGKSRMFQYEKTQSRIGETLWKAQHRYIENSPVFWADQVRTPLLMMHNDKDGAVPWYQGIEMFVALRRLGRPCWMLNYNGEQHGLTQDRNRRDWAVRMQQFFDHYCKGAPAPRWLSSGVPAVEKGRTLGLETTEKKTP